MQRSETQVSVQKLPTDGYTDTASIMAFGYNPYVASWSPYHGAAYAVVEAAAKVVAAGARYERMRYSYQEYFERMTRNPESWGKPLGAPRGKRPRIRVSCVDQLGACRCHHGHKPGDVFDFDRDRGKMCAMACHVGFPYIDILRYGGTVPGNEPGTAKFCCPEVDTLNVWLAEIVDE